MPNDIAGHLAVVSDFGATLEAEEGGLSDIVDVRRLPHPKETILSAMVALIGSDLDHSAKQMIFAGALELARYQPNVGPKVLRQVSLSRRPPPPNVSEEGFNDLMHSLLETTAQWEALAPVVAAERKAIERRLLVAAQAARVN